VIPDGVCCCRRNGFYPEQTERWRLTSEQANGTVAALSLCSIA
jgi:hypothetical protein